MHDQTQLINGIVVKISASIRLVYLNHYMNQIHSLRGCAYNQGCFDELMALENTF